jgi:proteasome lid subunit RPN8/RPN11
LKVINKDFVFPVYIYKHVLEEIKDLCKNSENEIFGYLIGLILTWAHKKYVIVKNQIHLRDLIKSKKFLTQDIEGTAGSYVREFEKLKTRDSNLLVIGWWHSHINIGCFLSPTDVHTQECFFPESYQIALVVDPIRGEYKFFTLDLTSLLKYKAINSAVII